MADLKLDLWEMFCFKKNNVISNIFDIELLDTTKMKNFDSVECHVVLYPFSRKINKKDYSFNPFEEYVKDISKNQRSAYERIHFHAKEIFGSFLGLLILLAFLKLRPDILLSVESVIGIFGAYFIGKDLWDDLEGLLINISKDWPFKYQESYYNYVLDKNSTMTQYTRYARKKRYGKEMILADKMDFIEHQNSSTARMYFSKASFLQNEKSMHLFSISVDPVKLTDFEKSGFLFGVKISLNKRFLFLESSADLFQSLEKGKCGCLDKNGAWLDDSVFFRKVVKLGRLKLYTSQGYLKNKRILA